MDQVEALNLMNNKNSQMCIGLDLHGSIEERMQAALTIIDDTHDLVSAYKPNRQYWLGATLDEMRELTTRIKKYNCFSIIDHKLSDIGSTNVRALQVSREEGFDMITVSPFPGNMKSNYEYAGELGIGLISLVMMSNPEAEWMASRYQDWAIDAEKYCSGIVVGSTNHVTTNILESIAELSPTTIVLAPGIGAQGGDPKPILKYFGKRALFNVSRGISQSDDYRAAAEDFNKQINKKINNNRKR